MTVLEKQQVIRYRDENPSLSLRKVAEVFSKIYGQDLDHSYIYRISKNREKIMNMSDRQNDCRRMKDPQEMLLMEELNAEITLRYRACDGTYKSVGPHGYISQITHNKISALALELAGQEKYDGFFVNHRFGQTWVSNFRKLYNIDPHLTENR